MNFCRRALFGSFRRWGEIDPLLQLRQIKVVASDDHLAVDAAIRSVFGLLATMDYVLLDADSRFLAQCQPAGLFSRKRRTCRWDKRELSRLCRAVLAAAFAADR